MNGSMTYGPVGAATEDMDAIIRATGLAFGAQPKGIREWLEFAGVDNLRALRDGANVAASLLTVPMGHYFGGRSVAVQGVAAVAVAPEVRGGGLGLRLMREQIREAAREGIPLSSLYASTQALYRQVGYEQAGLLFRTHIPLRTIGIRDRVMPVRQLGPEDQESVRDCYTSFARRFNGMLDRGPYVWSRVSKSREDEYTGFGVFSPEEPRTLEGYLFLHQHRKPDSGRHDIAISDLVFNTSRSGRRLLGLLGDFATIGDDAVLYGPPLHPLCTLMPQQHHPSRFVDVWMIRINLLRQALEARGYPPLLTASLMLEIADDLVPDNEGVWLLKVNQGRASVTRGESGKSPHLRCDIRALAPIYSGLYSASQASLLGLLEAETPALEAADTIFGGHTPWMADRF